MPAGKPKRVLTPAEQDIVLQRLADGWSIYMALSVLPLNERTSARIYKEDPVISKVLVKKTKSRFDVDEIARLAKICLAERQERMVSQD